MDRIIREKVSIDMDRNTREKINIDMVKNIDRIRTKTTIKHG